MPLPVETAQLERLLVTDVIEHALTDPGDPHRDPSGPALETRVPVDHRRAARVIRGANVLDVASQPRVEEVDGGAGLAIDERGDVPFHDPLWRAWVEVRLRSEEHTSELQSRFDL